MGYDYNRRANGTFGPGNEGSAGRPKKQREEAYLQATQANCSVEDWRDIVSTAVAFAKAGDHQARKWLSDNLIGLPTQRVDISVAQAGDLADLSDEQIDKILADSTNRTLIEPGNNELDESDSSIFGAPSE